MKVTITIAELEELLREAKKAYNPDAISMTPAVEIEMVEASTVHGISDRVNAGLLWGWNELGTEKIFTNN
ncbi:MAG: hypothetical protein KF870_07360 [Leadbetterella sp.]|nr:hypothetical protein [Leadbetterella sp.]